MELHERGWQVYRAYIDEHVDFVIVRYYCLKCKRASHPEQRKKNNTSFPTNLCVKCLKPRLVFIARFIQVKTSEGIEGRRARKYSFHAKLRSNIEDRSFYVWIAITQKGKNKKEPHYYIFNHKEIKLFDEITLDSYQRTDNQKTTLIINDDGTILNEGRKYDYSCFEGFHNAFESLEKILPMDKCSKGI